jgi:predicted LPLAT superfamily acyltransferase
VHWSDLGERGGVLGMRFLFAAYRLLGRWAFTLLLYPVVLYFFVTGGRARRASRQYLERVDTRLQRTNRPRPARLSTFDHFIQFGNAILDKGAMWAGVFPATSLEFADPSALQQFRSDGRGALFIGSHLGNIEVLRAFAENKGLVVNALVFTRHSPNLNRLLSIVGPRALERMIQVDSLGPDAIIRLQDKLRAGEHVAILGDRVSVRHRERSVYAPFLDHPAPFPEGPFVLASLLACPVYLLFCVKSGEKYKISLEPFADPLDLPRRDRRTALERVVAKYAGRLEAHCLLAPNQWFNFFDFWGQADRKTAE